LTLRHKPRPEAFARDVPMPKRNRFIERSLSSALFFLKEAVYADEIASRKGFLQSWDPRVKTAVFLLFILQVLFIKDILVLASLYALCLLLALASRIGLGFFLKRTWVFIPLFSLFIALPALFSFFTPGEALLVFKVAGLRLVITRPGAWGAAFFVMRVITSVSFVVLLSLTTPHFVLLRVLRVFGVPQVFVMTLGMCYRYIYLFMEVIENTYLSIKSRTGRALSCATGQHIVTWNIACLWSRSYQMNEEVYQAMLSRGYRGEPRVLNVFRTRPADWLRLCLVIVLTVLIVRRYG